MIFPIFLVVAITIVVGLYQAGAHLAKITVPTMLQFGFRRVALWGLVPLCVVLSAMVVLGPNTLTMLGFLDFPAQILYAGAFLAGYINTLFALVEVLRRDSLHSVTR